MADPNTRTGKRTPVTLKIKFKSETLDQFIERYAVDVSQGGIFIRTKEPLPVGTQMRFEFQLRDASPLIGGEGTVVWTRENDPSRPAIAPGMGVRFDRLAEGSQGVLERILAEKAKQAPHRPNSDSIKPPLFTDQPTRVAPAPIQEQLLGGLGIKPGQLRRKPDEDQHTPLPKPMPFHSDADEFPDEAFEEATKVRALDELVAQTADPSAQQLSLADELAARRPGRDSGPEPTPSRGLAELEAAPGLPSPPEPGALGMPPPPSAKGRLLDTTPSPRTESPTPAPPLASTAPPEPVKTKLGLEAPRMQSAAAALAGPGQGPSIGGPMSQRDAASLGAPSDASSPARAVAAESTSPVRMHAPAKRSSGAAIGILIFVVLVAGAAGVWFFVLRDKAKEPATPGSAAVATGSGSGSAAAPIPVGSAGSGSSQLGVVPGPGPGSAVAETPKGPLVETVIDASVPKARIEVVGSDQSGEAPLKAKLEKDKTFKVKVSAPGYVATELEVTGGGPKYTAALVPKQRVISFKTEPSGALIAIDGAPVPGAKLTPYEVVLTKAQAAKKTLRIRLFKTGFKPIDKSIPVDAFTEDDDRMIATVDEKLAVQQIVIKQPPTGTPGGTQGSGATPGSAATPPGGGEGTEPTPPPTPPTPPAGGSAAEPEPNL